MRRRDLDAEFGKQVVAFVGIDANLQDSLSEIGTFAQLHGVTFPLLKDNNNQIADRVGAIRTPEVFLLDRQRVIRYCGRIDDQYGLKTVGGYVKSKRIDRYLADAIRQVLAAKDVSRPVVNAEGCLIGRVIDKTQAGANRWPATCKSAAWSAIVRAKRPRSR